MVELRILEGEAKTDITFAYNANFFLYTTLENARPIAQGRVPPATTTFPVLTGMPVAGMAYLDRPGPAGYFIFPDLSVRHEGKYRLSFNLFEELKDPKDADVEPASASPADTRQLRNSMAAQAHVHFRLEVKSLPFNVYSAKKFPGLAESTSLSRIVAEQGCRVRIRRDVRMRRRDTKSTKGFDEWDEESTYNQTYQQQQPAQSAPRPQSASSGYSAFARPPSAQQAQAQSATPGGYNSYQVQQQTPQPQRPQSQNSIYGSIQQPSSSLAPPPQSANSGFTSHLSFGNSSASPYQPSNFHPPAAPASQPTQNYMSSNSGYPYPVTGHSRQMSNPQNGAYSQAQSSQSSPQTASFGHTQSTPTTSQPGGYSSQPQPSQSNAPQNGYSLTLPSQLSNPSNGGGYNLAPPSQPISQNRFSLAPPSHSNPQNRYSLGEPSPISNPSNRFSLAPASQTSIPPNKFSLAEPSQMSNPSTKFNLTERSELASSQNGGYRSVIAASTPCEGVTQYSYPVMPQRSNPGGLRTGKRPFGKVFSQDHITQPIHSGMRPDCSGQDLAQIEVEDGSLADEYDMASLKVLAYKRADGTKGIKRCPTSLSDSD